MDFMAVHHGFLLNPWTIVHGLLLKYLAGWTFHGLFMDCPWTVHANLAENPTNSITLKIWWIVHGQSMDSMDSMDGLWIVWLSVKYSHAFSRVFEVGMREIGPQRMNLQA